MNIKIAGIDVHPCLSPENDQWYFEALIHGHFKNKRPVRSIFGCAFSCIAASGFSTPEAPDKTSCWFQPFFNQLKKCGSSIGIMLLGLCEKSNMLTNIHQRGHHWYLYYYSASYICMTHTHTHIPFLDGLYAPLGPLFEPLGQAPLSLLLCFLDISLQFRPLHGARSLTYV